MWSIWGPPIDRLANEARTWGTDKPYEKSPAENYHASFVQNLMRPHVSPPSGPAVDEYSALQKQIDAGHYVDPNEIWDVVQALMEAGHQGYAERLARYLPD